MISEEKGYICNHCGVFLGDYQLCNDCIIKVIKKIKRNIRNDLERQTPHSFS